jgi:hypothetical protein
MAKGVRKNITVPGLLAPALRTRAQEFGHKTVSPLVVDLVCYDLKSGAPHTITLAIESDTQAAQDAVDAELVARYRPGQERTGLLVEVVQRLTELRSVARHAEASPALTTRPARITFPGILWPSIELRWHELGYESLSAYVTGLIRYDLLVGGPHLFHAAADRPRQVEQALAREAQATRERKLHRKLFLDHLIERAEGRSLTSAELDAVKSEVARHLLCHIGGGASVIAARPRPPLQRKAKTLSSNLPRQRAD